MHFCSCNRAASFPPSGQEAMSSIPDYKQDICPSYHHHRAPELLARSPVLLFRVEKQTKCTLHRLPEGCFPRWPSPPGCEWSYSLASFSPLCRRALLQFCTSVLLRECGTTEPGCAVCKLNATVSHQCGQAPRTGSQHWRQLWQSEGQSIPCRAHRPCLLATLYLRSNISSPWNILTQVLYFKN